MHTHTRLAEEFDRSRSHLRAVAYRMLGSADEAEDAVQEGWLRASTADADAVTNLTGWLTVIVSRICLDMLRSRRHRREDFVDVAELDRMTAPARATRRMRPNSPIPWDLPSWSCWTD